MIEKIPVKISPIIKQYIWGVEEWILSDLHEEVEHTPILVKIINAKDHLSYKIQQYLYCNAGKSETNIHFKLMCI